MANQDLLQRFDEIYQTVKAKEGYKITFDEYDQKNITPDLDRMWRLIQDAHTIGALEGARLAERGFAKFNLGLITIKESDKKGEGVVQIYAPHLHNFNINVNTMRVIEDEPTFWRRVKLAFNYFKDVTNYTK